jgi:hypothetical protein
VKANPIMRAGLVGFLLLSTVSAWTSPGEHTVYWLLSAQGRFVAIALMLAGRVQHSRTQPGPPGRHRAH